MSPISSVMFDISNDWTVVVVEAYFVMVLEYIFRRSTTLSCPSAHCIFMYVHMLIFIYVDKDAPWTYRDRRKVGTVTIPPSRSTFEYCDNIDIVGGVVVFQGFKITNAISSFGHSLPRRFSQVP